MTTNGRTRPAVAFIRHCRDYELDVRREAHALVAQGFDCDVFYLGQRGTPRVTTIDGVTLRRLPGSKSRGGAIRYLAEYLAFLIVSGLAVGGLHLRRRYRVIQVNTMPDFLVYAAWIPKLMGARVVVFMQEPTPELAQSLGSGSLTVKVLCAIEQRAIRFADRAITVTERLRERYVERGADGESVSVVLNGPDPVDIMPAGTRRVRDGDEDRFIVLCHGTIEDRYGHDTLIDAIAIASVDVPTIELVITGRGGGVDPMLQRIEDRSVMGRVRYEGWVSEERLAELLCEADVGVVAQKASPYSHLVHTNKMYDYWIAGLPVVATRLQATAADFDEDTIAYFEPDDPLDLAAQLVRLGGSAEQRRALAHAGRCAYERVGWHTQKECYLDVYRALVPEHFGSSTAATSCGDASVSATPGVRELLS